MNENTPNYETYKQLNSSGNWAYFIGFYYLAIGLFILSFGVFAFLNIENASMLNYFELSENVQLFLADTNKYVLLFFCMLASGIVFLNAFYLIKFRGNAMSFFMTDNDKKLSKTYSYLSKYLFLNSIFTILSIIISIVAILYYILI